MLKAHTRHLRLLPPPREVAGWFAVFSMLAVVAAALAVIA